MGELQAGGKDAGNLQGAGKDARRIPRPSNRASPEGSPRPAAGCPGGSDAQLVPALLRTEQRPMRRG